jgi:hypothetical protein
VMTTTGLTEAGQPDAGTMSGGNYTLQGGFCGSRPSGDLIKCPDGSNPVWRVDMHDEVRAGRRGKPRHLD